jgi:protease-4
MSIWLVLVLTLTLVGGLGLVLVFLASWAFGELGATAMVSRGSFATRHLREVVLEDNGSRNKVLVVELSGVISTGRGSMGGGLVDSVRAQLDRAAEDARIKAVVLRVDSPGGEVLASDEIYSALRSFQTDNEIPVVASMGSLAASGGYYVSAPCRWIVAHPLTLTGSIGVIFHGYNYRDLMDKVGIRPDVVKSGKLKDMFSGEQRPEDVLPEEKAILKDLVAESFDRFKQVIREGRAWAAEQNRTKGIPGGRTLSSNWEEIADGRILSGTQALNAGLVDELGGLDAALDRALTLAGVEDANVVTYHEPPRFMDLLGLWGQARSSRVQIDVPGLLPSATLPPGRLYYVSPLHVR